MKTPHKHAEVTIAWLQDQSIKLEYKFDSWLGWATPCTEGINPISHPDHQWRIKPEPKPDVVGFYYANKNGYMCGRTVVAGRSDAGNLKLTFDSEGELKSAEVI